MTAYPREDGGHFSALPPTNSLIFHSQVGPQVGAQYSPVGNLYVCKEAGNLFLRSSSSIFRAAE